QKPAGFGGGGEPLVAHGAALSEFPTLRHQLAADFDLKIGFAHYATLGFERRKAGPLGAEKGPPTGGIPAALLFLRLGFGGLLSTAEPTQPAVGYLLT
ncbi:MAG: hypothetical protein WBE50_03970, partial [Methyloceanibacter sp.]